MKWAGFSGLSDKALALLQRHIDDLTLEPPLYEAALQSLGLSAAWQALEPFAGLNRETLLLLLEAISLERALKAPSPIELVWTGPEPTTSTVRHTTMVMRDTLARARSDVFIAGYTFDHDCEILHPLSEAVNIYGVTVTIVINIVADGALPAEKRVTHAVTKFLRENWPRNTKPPLLYHDPRSSSQRHVASMHAKTIVADTRYCLVGSANFTRRGLERNIEMGLLVDSPQLAGQILSHWQALVQAGYLQVAKLPDVQ